MERPFTPGSEQDPRTPRVTAIRTPELNSRVQEDPLVWIVVYLRDP